MEFFVLLVVKMRYVCWGMCDAALPLCTASVTRKCFLFKDASHHLLLSPGTSVSALCRIPSFCNAINASSKDFWPFVIHRVF